MNVLAIETSTTACCLGLRQGDQTMEQFVQLKRTHSREILPRIASLLADTGVELSALDLIVYGKGPGSFTGLRIAVGVVQGLGYGLGIPVVGISTLACCAQGRYREFGDTNIVVAETARADEVFFGAYGVVDGHVRPVQADGMYLASELPAMAARRWVGIGSAWHQRPEMELALGNNMAEIQAEVYPRAPDLLDLGILEWQAGRATEALQATPEYLREQVASRPAVQIPKK
jgi:tRNA threonylcarbamoyladenosine biosynthesis protein TsaB